MHADAVGIDIGQRLQKVDTAHLVGCLHHAQLAEGGLLEGQAAVLAAAVVEDEEHVAFLRHVGLPAPRHIVPAGLHVAGVRTAIDIDDRGVFLRGIEMRGLHHAVVEVGHTVGSLNGAA